MSAHILHVVESFAAGTLGIVRQIVNQQAADGFRVSLAHSLRAETPPDWRAQLHAAVDCHYLPMRRALAPWADLKCLVLLERLLTRLNPDIVHLHSSKAGALGRIAALRRRGAQWFFSPHGLSFLQSTKPGRVHPVYLGLELLLSRLPAAIVACSPSEAALVRRYLHRSPLVVPNGISLDPIHSRAAPRDTYPVVVGTAGRVSLARNPQLVARIAQRMRTPDLRFVWLGGGEPDDEARLRDAGVDVTGWMAHERLLEAMQGLDIYLQASLWEGLPVAVMEAMATGLPVVASDIVGNRDLVQHCRTGWLAGTEDDFVAGIGHLAGDASLRQAWGGAGRTLVERQHSTQSMMQRLYEAYGL